MLISAGKEQLKQLKKSDLRKKINLSIAASNEIISQMSPAMSCTTANHHGSAMRLFPMNWTNGYRRSCPEASRGFSRSWRHTHTYTIHQHCILKWNCKYPHPDLQKCIWFSDYSMRGNMTVFHTAACSHTHAQMHDLLGLQQL